ncbi:MAG: flagellar basal body P-ring protein FlgI [Planctomycetales bacterium]|nr:flagellar basal body P-ring protein FlgI [Planctomycetales bacterium]
MKSIIPAIASCAIVCLGCTSPAIRSQSPELDPAEETASSLIGDLARPYGLDYIQVEAVSLATGLNGQGEDPPPTPQRAVVLGEMRRRDIPDPGRVLASLDTALVVVRGYLRPGIQKGDSFDVEVRVPSQSEAKSLRGGWLLEARMSELLPLGGQIHSGRLLALSQGPILVDPSNDDDLAGVHQTRGMVLGGGTALNSRTLGLVLYDEHHSVRSSQQIGRAINHRFHTYIRGDKQGVANPKTDEFIELIVHPRYKDDVARYMQVVRNIAYIETPRALQARLDLLERQLMDPVTSATAAVRLEAIGNEGIDVLRRGLGVTDPEVRFYSAEALAYLDDIDAAEALGRAARDEPAFRARALNALAAMNSIGARDQLSKLLSEESAETRYGAFRALHRMDPHDSLLRHEELGEQISLHVLEIEGPPMVHVTRSQRPEIVLFGKDQQFELPVTLEAGPNILVTGHAGDSLTVSRFYPGEPDQKRTVSRNVADVIRAIADLGGTYPDIVQALQKAKDSGALASRMRVDALPDARREYEREDEATETNDEGGLLHPGGIPNLFRRFSDSAS